jgi:hypothetical protein
MFMSSVTKISTQTLLETSYSSENISLLRKWLLQTSFGGGDLVEIIIRLIAVEVRASIHLDITNETISLSK